LHEKGWVEKCRAHNAEWRAKLAAGIEAAGIKVYRGEGNFVLADFVTVEHADAADMFLRQRGLIVRRVGSYGLAHCLRITVGTAEECGMVIDALTDFMKQARG
jgi:histidinol-phosphate aminotransferase